MGREFVTMAMFHDDYNDGDDDEEEKVGPMGGGN